MAKRILINLPDDVRSWVDAEAQREDRTKTVVILRAIRQMMREQQREQAVR